MHIAELQELIRSRDTDAVQIHDVFLKLSEEMGELAEAIRIDKPKQFDKDGGIKNTVAEELYDVLYYVLCLANLHEVDLEVTHQMKEIINNAKYNRE